MTKHIVGMACLVLAAVLFCLHAAAFDAEAARFGGGRSFGGKSSYSRSAPAPQQQGSYAASQTRNPAAGAAAAQARPGMGSGFRGMLGGLLAGTLLGSLFFGGPHAGFGMMDIALIALLAFLALKVFKLFMARRVVAPDGNARAAEDFTPRPDPWQGLRDASAHDAAGQGDMPRYAAGGHAAGSPDIRLAGFDQEDFLRGAKMVYSRLQESWDRRDVDDIATFATQAIVSEVAAQAEADPTPSTTEIMLVNASLVSAERDGDEDVVTVYFDVLLRENQDAQTPSQVRELWHFTRPSGSTQSWRLDGIQQVV